MIYHIYVFNEDDEYKDVSLDAAITDYSGETWSATITLGKDDAVILDTLWRVSDDQDYCFRCVEKGDVPRWFRAMHDKMKPRIVEEHFQTLIDEWKARQIEQAESQ